MLCYTTAHIVIKQRNIVTMPSYMDDTVVSLSIDTS